VGVSIHPDYFNRTAKIFADSGEAASLAEAEQMLSSFVLQVLAGRCLRGNLSRQAALLTVVNAAGRAFEGGVLVQLLEDPELEVGWARGRKLSDALRRYGALVVDHLVGDYPTICVGEAEMAAVQGRPVLRATFDGWAAGVVEGAETPLQERGSFVPTGIAAGAISVAEAFEFRRGNVFAGRRSQGVSLWRPEVGWLADEARGPLEVRFAPSRWWLVGLGHLGQGYLWSIGMLPYASPAEVSLLLQDDDHVTKANESTGLLLGPGLIGQRKTRVLAKLLESRGFTTTITERRMQPGQGPIAGEPLLALIGVDNSEARSMLSEAGFEFVVDAGLGGGPVHYLDMQVHTFPSARRSTEVAAWQQPRSYDLSLLSRPAYSRAAADSADQCGTVDLAGRSVAAAFVGATAGALVVAEATRALMGAHRYGVIDSSLRDLGATRVADTKTLADLANTGFAGLA
jgi:hypothetical protein